MRKLDPLNLNGIPGIVGILDQEHDHSDLIKLKKSGVSLLEVRIDSFETPELGLHYLKKLSQNTEISNRFASIATHRENEKNKGKRSSVFLEAIKYANAIDVEYECQEKKELIDLINTNNKISILSSHDFEKTPSIMELKAVLKDAENLGADICKIAVYANTIEDMLNLMDFTYHNKNKALVTISMGEYGLISRIQSLFCGSLFSYGFIQKANAPGQLSVFELHKLLMQFHPDYKNKFRP